MGLITMKKDDMAPGAGRARVCRLVLAATLAWPVGAAIALEAASPPSAGLPLPELAPGSPERYAVRPGDTLRTLASLFLKAPWRWPQLWTRPDDPRASPPPIHPGQVLVLERHGDRASLRAEPAAAPAGIASPLRVSPRVRVQLLPEAALPPLEPHLIEPFLAEPLIVDEDALRRAPRIVAALDGRVLITQGDRIYARGPEGSLLDGAAGARAPFGIFREARPVRDPVSQAVLGYEARYVGRALLVKPQGRGAGPLPLPAALDVVSAREEIQAGDWLLPEPPRGFLHYAPHAPEAVPADGRIAAIHGDALGRAAQNQIVVINKGSADGMASGQVLALVRDGPQALDRKEPGLPERIQLPDERKGLVMVFRTFERLSYALVLETDDGVQAGDRVVAPR